MIREFTCIVCPNGCGITAEVENGELLSLTGAICKRGEAYVRQELTDPRRTISSSVAVRNGELPLASVRLDTAVPKDRIFDVMQEIGTVRLEAPVYIGDVAIENVLGLGSNVIVTKNVERK
ncbi:MAG: DUF1667 domain-containing protein [Lachnospiraceae bacterium]|jgi:CxxC motif-containing protein|nr:DUF1667 domain-containing protein [Lachnospiraceae bacterium]